MPKGIVVTDEGKKFQLAPRVEAGLVKCPGEAHENAYIDNCMLCAPRWGQTMSYEPPTVESVLAGFAVMLSETRDNRAPFEDAEREGKITMVHVTEKTRATTSSFYVWVKA